MSTRPALPLSTPRGRERSARTTLFHALRRAYVGSTVFALAFAGAALLVVTLIALRAQVEDNLNLVARTIAYAAEAAVMFDDRDTAGEILAQVVAREHLAMAEIVSADGDRLARQERVADAALLRIGTQAAGWLLPGPVSAEIRHELRLLGEVTIVGDGSALVGFIATVVSIGLACMALAGLAARRFARRMERRITAQLDALASIAHAARMEQHFERRLPSFEIAEFDALGQDFNALFAALQTRNSELVARQSSLEQANQSLTRLVLRDSLTGLANRAGFAQRLERALGQARHGGKRLGVLYLDNDRFKDVNDRFGHAAGDALLIEVARRIRSAIRDADLVARLGGDEFAVLLEAVRDTEDAVRVARKILDAMAEPVDLGTACVLPGVSIGIALFPDHADDGEQLLRAADHAMYQAKRGGRGDLRIFDPASRLNLGDPA